MIYFVSYRNITKEIFTKKEVNIYLKKIPTKT